LARDEASSITSRLLERPTALDEDAASCRLRYAGDERGRGRQNQRARCCCDQHGQAPDRISREKPRGTGQDQRDRQQQQGVAIRQADERSLGGLGRRYHADDTGIGALARGRCGAQLERLAGVERAAPRRLPGRAADRNRLARQRRLVDQGLGAGDHSIDGDDLAGAHDHLIADHNILDRDILNGAPEAAVRPPWRPIGQRLEIPLGARNGIILKHGATRIHDGDNRPRQVLPERQRGHHGDECDGVDAYAPGEEVARHRDQ
jgi:hypothetical protein